MLLKRASTRIIQAQNRTSPWPTPGKVLMRVARNSDERLIIVHFLAFVCDEKTYNSKSVCNASKRAYVG
jgi:hypothetical protein